jgi:hypothetical protein
VENGEPIEDDYLFLSASMGMGLRISGSKDLPSGEYRFTVTLITDDDRVVKNEITITK